MTGVCGEPGLQRHHQARRCCPTLHERMAWALHSEGPLAAKRRRCANPSRLKPVSQSARTPALAGRSGSTARTGLKAPGVLTACALSMGMMFSSSSLSHLLQIITLCRVRKSSENPTQVLVRKVPPSDLKGGLCSMRAGKMSPDSQFIFGLFFWPSPEI